MPTTVEQARETILQFLRDNPTMMHKDVAAHFGCSRATISALAKRAGIQPPRWSRLRGFKQEAQ